MMKDEIEDIFERVRSWPEEQQERAAALLLALEAQGPSVYVLSEEERADLEAALEEAERGEVAPEEDVRAVFGRYRHA